MRVSVTKRVANRALGSVQGGVILCHISKVTYVVPVGAGRQTCNRRAQAAAMCDVRYATYVLPSKSLEQ